MKKLTPLQMHPETANATVQGLKTQTRRLTGLGKVNKNPDAVEFLRLQVFPDGSLRAVFQHQDTDEPGSIKCPYGQPGDVLWIKEDYWAFGQWLPTGLTKTGQGSWRFSDLTGTDFCYKYGSDQPQRVLAGKTQAIGWYKRPALFMPMAACRQYLEIVNIRVERLQQISTEDACNEGVEYFNVDSAAFDAGELVADYKNYMWRDDEKYEEYFFPTYANAVLSFKSLWIMINGQPSWDLNPWVWVIEYKKTIKPVI